MKALPTPEPVPFRHGLGNSIEMLRAALSLLGVAVDTPTLAGISGAAFRTYWPIVREGSEWTPGWHEETLSVCAFDSLAAASEACGWRLLRYRGAAPQVIFQYAMQAIARRQPVLLCGFAGEPEEAITLGCDRTESGRTLLLLTRHAPAPIRVELAEEASPEGIAPDSSISLFSPIPQHRRRARENEIQRSLRRAVWLAGSSDLPGRRNYRSGLAAYEVWMQALLRAEDAPGAREAAERIASFYQMELPRDAEGRTSVGIRHVLHCVLNELASAREEAAAFVRAQSELFDTGEASSRLDGEAEALGQAAALWPRVVTGHPGDFHLASSPQAPPIRLRCEETARWLQVASTAHAEAIRAIADRVPPTEQELLASEDADVDLSDESGGGGGD